MPKCARCGTDDAAMSRMDANIWFCVGRDADPCALRVELRDVKAQRDALEAVAGVSPSAREEYHRVASIAAQRADELRDVKAERDEWRTVARDYDAKLRVAQEAIDGLVALNDEKNKTLRELRAAVLAVAEDVQYAADHTTKMSLSHVRWARTLREACGK